MPLKFHCKECGELIVVQYLRMGEVSECKSCGVLNVVPDSAEDTEEMPDYITGRRTGRVAGMTGVVEPPEDILVRGSGFWLRGVARSIDMILHNGAAFAGMIWFTIPAVVVAVGRGRPLAALFERTDPPTAAFVLFAVAGHIVYHTLCEGLSGTTAGKLICRLAVVKEDQTPCTWTAALGRSVAYLLDSMFFGIVGWVSMKETPLRQRWGDRWFHTAVIKRRELPPAQRHPGSYFAATFMGAIMADAVICGLPIVLWQ